MKEAKVRAEQKQKDLAKAKADAIKAKEKAFKDKQLKVPHVYASGQSPVSPLCMYDARGNCPSRDARSKQADLDRVSLQVHAYILSAYIYMSASFAQHQALFREPQSTPSR